MYSRITTHFITRFTYTIILGHLEVFTVVLLPLYLSITPTMHKG